jgi:DNA modification methylase
MLELNKIYNQDCLEGLKQLPDNSVDSIVTDPPYELGFMGKAWDKTGVAYNIELWKECLRVLKPGGYLLAFGGTRTYHRMVCAIEDAGFEIRDTIQWIYGSGFPKNMDISKAIDKKFGAEREVIGINTNGSGNNGRMCGEEKGCGYKSSIFNITTPSTKQAKQYEGFGTSLKPANEPIVVARKPLSEKTVADNVLKWGTGGINIDDCRIEYNNNNESFGKPNTEYNKDGGFGFYEGAKKQIRSVPPQSGRFPANVIFDEDAGKILDEQSGTSKSSDSVRKNNGKHDNKTFGKYNAIDSYGFNDSGGASRFFYCAKASKSERGDGNFHPTVKPIKLIKYLIKLVTPPNGICLDPFEGSGTHAIACSNLGFNYIGFEMNEEYCEIANKRIEGHIKI